MVGITTRRPSIVQASKIRAGEASVLMNL